MPDLMLDPDGRLAPKDNSEIELWLALHGESRAGKAWIFSTTGIRRDTFYFPKAMCEIGEPCGGFERMDDKCQRVRFTVHPVSMPKFKAVEKRLVAA